MMRRASDHPDEFTGCDGEARRAHRRDRAAAAENIAPPAISLRHALQPQDRRRRCRHWPPDDRLRRGLAGMAEAALRTAREMTGSGFEQGEQRVPAGWVGDRATRREAAARDAGEGGKAGHVLGQ